MITFTTKKKQKKKKTETLHEKLDTCDEKTRVHVYIFGYWSLRIIDRSRAWQSYKNRFNSTASIVTLESRMQGSLEWLFQVNCSMRDWFETRFELRSIPWVLLALNLPSKATSESDIQANYAGGWDKRRKVFERRWSPGTNPKTCSGVPSEPKVPMNWIFDLWWGWWRWRVCVCVCVFDLNLDLCLAACLRLCSRFIYWWTDWDHIIEDEDDHCSLFKMMMMIPTLFDFQLIRLVRHKYVDGLFFFFSTFSWVICCLVDICI